MGGRIPPGLVLWEDKPLPNKVVKVNVVVEK
jgi:hypothetical protein